VVTLNDITERKQAGEEIEKQARLLNLSHDAILLRDPADRITYWNTGAEEVYGYTKEEALGRISHELLRTEFPQPLEEIFEILNCNSSWTGELIHTRKDDRKVIVFTHWVLDRDSQGNPTLILEANSDITKRKQAEEALWESRAKLEAAIESMTDAVFI
jgi:PAS domain S-box-containing protein